MTEVCSEHGLADVLTNHLDLMVARAKVKLREYNCTVDLIHQLVHGRNLESVLDRNRVKNAIVDTKMPSAILLAHQKYRERKWAKTMANEILSMHL